MAAQLGAIPVEANDDAVAAILAETGDRGADAVIECAGGVPALTSALKMARPRGTVSVIGAHLEPDSPLTPGPCSPTRPRFGSRWEPPRTTARNVIGLIRSGQVDPTVAISHWMPLDEAAEAYRLFEARKATKILLLTPAGRRRVRRWSRLRTAE